jgi:hypothetical protein
MAPKKSTAKNKGGRPKAKISAQTVSRMAANGCTNVEIADVLGCDEGTIRKRFAAQLTTARGKIRQNLRRAQLKGALKGNTTMQIWLGKQMLGQADESTLRIKREDLEKLSDEELERLAGK